MPQNRVAQLRCLAIALWFAVVCPGLEAQQPARSTRWALLVGVDNYIELGRLQYAGNDQRALAEQLAASGFPQDQVFLLHDQASENKYLPFRENIEKSLTLVLGLAEPGDLVIVGFSGHGVQLDGKSYICPVDARLDKLPATLVPLDDIYQRLGKCRASLKLLVVDACRNNVVPAGRRSMAMSRSLGEFAGAQERPPEGILLLASCGGGQVSMEDEKFGHGVFMHYVLEGLRGRAANEEGAVSLAGLYDYASLQTKKYVARKFNEQQTPALRGEINGPFVIAATAPRPPAANGPDLRKDLAGRWESEIHEYIEFIVKGDSIVGGRIKKREWHEPARMMGGSIADAGRATFLCRYESTGDVLKGLIEVQPDGSTMQTIWWQNGTRRDTPRKIWKSVARPEAETQPRGEGFVRLFDGRTFDGWHKNGIGQWAIEDGAIVGHLEGTSGGLEFGHLISDREYSDFTLRTKFQVRGDSGVYLRGVEVGSDGMNGLQANLEAVRNNVGGLVEVLAHPTTVGLKVRALSNADSGHFRPSDWNDMTITAIGTEVSVAINGVMTARVTDYQRRQSGVLALQLVVFRSGEEVHAAFKDIEIREEHP